MTGKIVRPQPQELFDRYKDLFSQIVLGGKQIIPESNEWYAASLNYAIAEEFYAISAERANAMDPRTACCDDLIALAALDGIYPRPAIPASGYIEISGTAGTPLPYPLQFDIAGRRFTAASPGSQPSAIQPDGTAIIRVRAETPGAIITTPSAQVVLTTSVPGVQRNARLCGALCGGQNAESCDEFRARYLRRLRVQPHARMSWIIDKLREWPCVTRVIPRGGSCCTCQGGCGDNCNCRNCGGKMDFYVMFDGTFPCGIAPNNVLLEVETWLFGDPQGYGLGEVEIGICGKIVQPKPFIVDVRISIDGCASVGMVSRIEEAVRDFFGTISPSVPVLGNDVAAAVANVIGSGNAVAVSFVPANSQEAFGPAAENAAQTHLSLAYLSGCDIEPECDVLPCLRNVIVTPTGGKPADCT